MPDPNAEKNAYWIASRDDAGAPTLYCDDLTIPAESWLGSTMWEVRREAAHRNGEHATRPNPRCACCLSDGGRPR